MAISSICKQNDLMQIKVDDKSVWMGRDAFEGCAVKYALEKVRDTFNLNYVIEFFDKNGELLD